MNSTDANGLAVRYKNIWRGGPALDELRQTFAEMDTERARATMTTLAQTHEHPPTIATIWRTYTETNATQRHMIRDVLPDYSNAVPPPWIAAGVTRAEWLDMIRRHPSQPHHELDQ